MNNVERLADLFGSKANLASVCGVDRAEPTRWSKSRDENSRGNNGRIPVKHNLAIREHARMLTAGAWSVPSEARDFINQVEACLDAEVCPTCGQPLNDGRVV